MLRRYVLRDAVDERLGATALSRWRRLDVERYPHESLLERVWALRANISACDAGYVALAEALSTVLVTGDRTLAAAPGVRAAIELIQLRQGRTVTAADREKWDRRYAEGSYQARTYPSPFLAERMAELPTGRALDLACGAGRNALCLAEAGYEVEALDISEVAIERARATARERGLKVDWRVADLDDFAPPPGRFDLITVIRYTNRKLMERLPEALTEGGMLLIEHHLRTDAGVGGPTSRAFRLAPNELIDLYHGRLRVLFHDERIAPDPDGKPMALARFLGCRGSPGF